MGAFDFHSLEGLSRSLNGSTQYFSRASSAALNPGANDFAVCAWVYLDALAADTSAYVVAKLGAAGNYGYQLYIRDDAGAVMPRLLVSGDGTAIVVADPATDVLNVTTWHFLAAWYDQSAGDIFVQVDNGTIYTNAAGPAAIFDSTAALEIGATTGGTIPVDGRVAKVGLWIGSFPTTAQWTQLFNAGKGRTRYILPDALLTNLVGWWAGDEISGNLLDGFASYDLTAVGAPGTAAGPDVADVLTVAHPRKPSYPVGQSIAANVVTAESLGGRLRSQERGDDRQIYTLSWSYISATHKGYLDTWAARYLGAREPFYLELPDGSRLRVRAPQTELRYARGPRTLYSVSVELVEDIL